LIKATECGFHFCIARELPAFGLTETFQDRREMRGVDLFRFAIAGSELKHCPRNFILDARRQAADCLECTFEKLGHGTHFMRRGAAT